MKKTHWKKLDNPNYLGAYSLMDGEKKEINLTIKKVVVEEVKTDRGSDSCKVAYFEEEVKPMILNTTNSKAIEKITDTPYIEDWQGQKVCVYIAEIKAFGEKIDALRIKKPIAKTLTKERFDKALEAVKNGTFDKVKLLQYDLTKEQREQVQGI